MSDSTTARISSWIERLQRGDEAAREQLLHCAGDRLQRLAHTMLSDYPAVKALEQTDDVLQNSLVRLWHALEDVKPPGVRQFFGLAAEQIRRELIDLARHYRLMSQVMAPVDNQDSNLPLAVAADSQEGPPKLAMWSEFHERVGALPPKQREIVDLLWYQELPQTEVAKILGKSERTIRRRWHRALRRLYWTMHGELPVDRRHAAARDE